MLHEANTTSWFPWGTCCSKSSAKSVRGKLLLYIMLCVVLIGLKLKTTLSLCWLCEPISHITQSLLSQPGVCTKLGDIAIADLRILVRPVSTAHLYLKQADSRISLTCPVNSSASSPADLLRFLCKSLAI